MAENDLMKKASRWLAVFLCFLFLAAASYTFAYQQPGVSTHGHRVLSDYGAIKKILWVLESRGSDRKTLGMAQEKLLVINMRQLHLIYSLCDRISTTNDSAGADIAFSLITAMIVLS